MKRFGMPVVLGCCCAGYVLAQVRPTTPARGGRTPKTTFASKDCIHASDIMGGKRAIACARNDLVLVATVAVGNGPARDSTGVGVGYLIKHGPGPKLTSVESVDPDGHDPRKVSTLLYKSSKGEEQYAVETSGIK